METKKTPPPPLRRRDIYSDGKSAVWWCRCCILSKMWENWEVGDRRELQTLHIRCCPKTLGTSHLTKVLIFICFNSNLTRVQKHFSIRSFHVPSDYGGISTKILIILKPISTYIIKKKQRWIEILVSSTAYQLIANLTNKQFFMVSQVSFFYVYLFSEQKEGGTQLKLIIDYGNNFEALFKPMR